MFNRSGRTLGLALVASIAMSGAAFAAAHLGMPVKHGMAGGAKVLTNAKGMTLYTFDKDKKGMSNCYGKCAVKWPPLMAKKAGMGKGDLSVVKRKDGSLQWAYKGKPLYTWIKDKKAGDATGDGVKGVWHAAKP